MKEGDLFKVPSFVSLIGDAGTVGHETRYFGAHFSNDLHGSAFSSLLRHYIRCTPHRILSARSLPGLDDILELDSSMIGVLDARVHLICVYSGGDVGGWNARQEGE